MRKILLLVILIMAIRLATGQQTYCVYPTYNPCTDSTTIFDSVIVHNIYIGGTLQGVQNVLLDLIHSEKHWWASKSTAGTVISFSSGNLSPLFTTSVSNPNTTPSLSFSLSTVSANKFLGGNSSGGATAPTYRSLYWNALPSGPDTIPLSLTTTGTSGAATYNTSTGVLNIPQYAGTTYSAGTGLSLSGSTFSITNTAVTAGSYTNANVTVNAQGQITGASNGIGSSPAGSATQIQYNSGSAFAAISKFTLNGTTVQPQVIIGKDTSIGYGTKLNNPALQLQGDTNQPYGIGVRNSSSYPIANAYAGFYNNKYQAAWIAMTSTKWNLGQYTGILPSQGQLECSNRWYMYTDSTKTTDSAGKHMTIMSFGVGAKNGSSSIQMILDSANEVGLGQNLTPTLHNGWLQLSATDGTTPSLYINNTSTTPPTTLNSMCNYNNRLWLQYNSIYSNSAFNGNGAYYSINTSNGNAAYCGFVAKNDLGHFYEQTLVSSGYSGLGLLSNDMSLIYNNGANGMLFANATSNAIVFSMNNYTSTSNQAVRIDSLYCTGFGGASAKGASFLKIAAGTTTIAPLILTAGTNLTTAASGGIEYDGNNIYATPISTERGVIPTTDINNDLTSKTANTGIDSITTPSSNQTYEVGGYVNITAISTDVLTIVVIYTDEGNNTQTINLASAGLLTSFSSTGDNPLLTMGFKAKASTKIALRAKLTTGIGSITYNVGGFITRIYK